MSYISYLISQCDVRGIQWPSNIYPGMVAHVLPGLLEEGDQLEIPI